MAQKSIDEALAYQGDECLLWPHARNAAGYAVATERHGTRLVSRYICIETNGAPADPSLEAAHSCSNGHNGCITPRHLYWATSKQNSEDTVAVGRSTRGEKNARARLTEDQARQILSLRGTMQQRDIAKMFKIGDPQVSAIMNGKSWAWLNETSTTAKSAG